MHGDEELFRELKQVVRDTPVTESVPEPEDLLDRSAAIPGYELREELYRGGQGIVFRALQKATRREVALKLLLRGRNASARDRMRFEREIDLASRLRHPDIVTIYDSGIADGRPYFAMELVQGRRLDVHLAKHSPSLKERLALFARIASAVAAAHRRGVIHRDLKPSNILVEDDGHPHILDFGIAKATGDEERVTATGEFMGTLAYASPEQVQGDPADVDTRSDVYSLGVLLYEMITGHLPYDVSGSMSQAIDNITRHPPEDPRTLGAHVDDELFLVLQAALAKDVDERYSSADALARDVEHYLAGEPIEARGRSTWYVLRKSIVRQRVPIAAACLALIVVAAGAALLVRERLRAERQSENATLVREVFQDVLGAAAPQRMGSSVTLLEIYEEAAGRMEAALDDAPDAQAEFHFTIGDTYRSLLMWPEAADHLEKALERYRAVEGAELEVARCLEVYGLVLSELDPPRALLIQTEALELRRAALDEEHVDVAANERSLAIALMSQYSDQDYEGARALLLSALAKQTAAHGSRHPEVGATKFWLARLAIRNGRPLDGKRLFEEAVASFEQADPIDPRLVDALAALANVHRGLDDFAAAKTHLDRAVELTTELYGNERDVEMLRAYANLHFDQGEYVTAERLSRQAVVKELERWARKRPEDAGRIANVQRRLQITEAAGGEPPYAEAFAILRECRGNGAFELANWANGIAVTLLPQERGAATEPLLREVLNIRCRAFGMSCPNRVSTLLLLAQVLADQDRPAEAVPLLEEVLATLERVDETESSKGDEARALLELCRTLAVDRAG